MNNLLKELANIFYDNRMAYIASGVVFALFIGYCIYNGMYYIFNPSKYHGIRFTTKNIAYITVLSAVSVTATIVVSVTFPITVFPPIRIAFEGLMVKITGYIFGPIVGLISGLVTDSLTLLFVPSYIHISYTIVIASFGFLSGTVSSLNRAVGKHKWVIFWFASLFTLAFGFYACAITYYYQGAAISNKIELFAGLAVSKNWLIAIIGIGTAGTVLILWVTAISFKLLNKDNKFKEIMPIILLAILNEYWVTTLISAWGDSAFMGISAAGGPGHDGYGITMITRLAMAPLKIAFNSAVIFITYRAIKPLVNRD